VNVAADDHPLSVPALTRQTIKRLQRRCALIIDLHLAIYVCVLTVFRTLRRLEALEFARQMQLRNFAFVIDDTRWEIDAVLAAYDTQENKCRCHLP
jgi:hypothetical protein